MAKSLKPGRTIAVAIMAGATIAAAGCGAAGIGGQRRGETDEVSKDSVTVVGRGHTLRGEPFVAALIGRRRVPKELSAFAKELEPRRGCPLPVFVKEGAQIRYNEVCYAPAEPSSVAGVECSEGQLLVHLVAPPATRRVRLVLSDGRHVTTSVMMLARRFGGPVALYYQAVPGPSPIPVSLTELGAHGNVLKTIEAFPVHGCSRDIVRVLPGAKTLVRAMAPGGQIFAISSQQTRILGATHLGLQVSFAGKGGLVTGTAALRLALPLEWEVSRICTPHPYVILYGILGAPLDQVLVRTRGGLHPLNHVALPSAVRSHSVLVYGILEVSPESLLVRAPGRKTVAEPSVGAIFAHKRCV